MAEDPTNQPESYCGERARNAHRDTRTTFVCEERIRAKANEKYGRDAADPVQNVAQYRTHVSPS